MMMKCHRYLNQPLKKYSLLAGERTPNLFQHFVRIVELRLIEQLDSAKK
jgi:hypothetical protein